MPVQMGQVTTQAVRFGPRAPFPLGSYQGRA